MSTAAGNLIHLASHIVEGLPLGPPLGCSRDPDIWHGKEFQDELMRCKKTAIVHTQGVGVGISRERIISKYLKIGYMCV